MKLFYTILYYFQKRGFEVCRRIAERLGISARVVRTSFIYLTFVTLGFGFALYLFLAFWLKIKESLIFRSVIVEESGVVPIETKLAFVGR